MKFSIYTLFIIRIGLYFSIVELVFVILSFPSLKIPKINLWTYWWSTDMLEESPILGLEDFDIRR